MDFTFSEDQILFRDSVREFLVNEVNCERIRTSWETETGRSDELWSQLAELGLTGLTVPEEFGGLGMSEEDFVLLAEECGYVALPEPLVQTVLVGVPALLDLDKPELNKQWLPAVAAGEARIAVGLAENLLVEDAHVSQLLLMQHDDELHAISAGSAGISANESVDPSRRLFRVDWEPSEASLVASGDRALELIGRALNRGALGVAAQSLGLAQRMIDLAVAYTSERQQFGKPIGSFQAVKHHMADIAVRLEYARAPVYRAAWSVANRVASSDRDVSHAKLVATKAADLAAKNCIQVHGAMGYTWEVDLHIFMKRAWAFNAAWGDGGFHKQRIAETIFSGGGTGVAATFR